MGQGRRGWPAGEGSPLNVYSNGSTSLLIPKDGQFCGTGTGRGRESSSAFVNSFQGQKPSWAQVFDYRRQVPLVATAIFSQGGTYRLQDGVEKTETPLPRAHQSHGRGNEPRGDKGHSSSPGARPQPQCVLSSIKKSLIKCNQFLCHSLGEGRGTCQRTLDVNRYANIFPYSWLVNFNARTSNSENAQSETCRFGSFHERQLSSPRETHTSGWARAAPGATLRRRQPLRASAQGGWHSTSTAALD